MAGTRREREFWVVLRGNLNVIAVHTSKKLSSGNQHAWSEEKTSWLKKDTVVCHCSSLPFDTNKYAVHVVTAKILLTCTLLNVHCKDSALSTSTEYTHWKHFLIKTLCAEYFNGISNIHYCCYQIVLH